MIDCYHADMRGNQKLWEIRDRDRAALRRMGDAPFTVPAFCAALTEILDEETAAARDADAGPLFARAA